MDCTTKYLSQRALRTMAQGIQNRFSLETLLFSFLGQTSSRTVLEVYRHHRLRMLFAVSTADLHVNSMPLEVFEEPASENDITFVHCYRRDLHFNHDQ